MLENRVFGQVGGSEKVAVWRMKKKRQKKTSQNLARSG